MNRNSSVYSSEEGKYMAAIGQSAESEQHTIHVSREIPISLKKEEIEQAIADGKQPFIFYPIAEDATFVYIVFPPQEISDNDVVEAVNTSTGLSFMVNRSEMCQHYLIPNKQLSRVESIIRKATKQAGQPMNHLRYALPVHIKGKI